MYCVCDCVEVGNVVDEFYELCCMYDCVWYVSCFDGFFLCYFGSEIGVVCYLISVDDG